MNRLPFMDPTVPKLMNSAWISFEESQRSENYELFLLEMEVREKTFGIDRRFAHITPIGCKVPARTIKGMGSQTQYWNNISNGLISVSDSDEVEEEEIEEVLDVEAVSEEAEDDDDSEPEEYSDMEEIEEDLRVLIANDPDPVDDINAPGAGRETRDFNQMEIGTESEAEDSSDGSL